MHSEGRELESDDVAGELLVGSSKGPDLGLETGLVLLAEEDDVGLVAVGDADALSGDGGGEDDVVEDGLMSVGDGHAAGADSLGAVAVDLGEDLAAGDKDKVLGGEALLKTLGEHGLDLAVLVALAEGDGDDDKVLLAALDLHLRGLKDAEGTQAVLDLLGRGCGNGVDGSSNVLLDLVGILLTAEDKVGRVLHDGGHVGCVNKRRKLGGRSPKKDRNKIKIK